MNVKSKATAVKNHVHHHRAKYAAAVTLAALTAVHQLRVDAWNRFLDDHNLMEAFYNPESE